MTTVLTYGRYELRELLGSGGLGQVYGGIDLRLKRQVAVKVLRPELANDTVLLERFMEEASNLASLLHPNITTLFALEDDPKPFMVMELVRGHTLEAILQRRRLTITECLAAMAQTIAGLAYAHHMGIIHRDIKPSNLMLMEGGLIKLMDFGIARVRGSKRLTQVGYLVGTPTYMSPEQIRGEEGDERSDLYSLAIMLYEMVSGAVPFNFDSDYDIRRAHVETAPPQLRGHVDGVSERIENALMRALEKDPAKRFATVEEFGQALGVNELPGAPTTILRSLIADPAFTQPQTQAIPASTLAETQLPPKRPTPAATLLPATPLAKPPAYREHLPLIALGVSLVVCLAVAAFIFLAPGPSPHLKQQASLSNPPPIPATTAILPPAPVTPPAKPKTTEVAPQPVIPQGPAPATPRPELSGSFAAALGSNTIDLAGQADDVQIFGIKDPPEAYSNPALLSQISAAISNIVNNAGGQLDCQPHDLKHYQCFLNNQDYAELVLRAGWSTVAADAPAAYLAAQAQARSDHIGLWAN